MSQVEFTYTRGGKKALMAVRYAELLQKMGHGHYGTRMLTAAPVEPPAPPPEPRVSLAVLEFALANGVNADTVVGTGKDGRVKKSDVEAVIAARE